MTEPPATEDPEPAGRDSAASDADRWEEIVASWSAPPETGSWPAAEDITPPRLSEPVPFRSWTPAEEPEHEHYAPPDPPPLPRVHPLTAWGVAALLVGLSLLVVPAAFGNPVGSGTSAVAVLALILGAVLLVARLRDSRDEDKDDGAVV